MVEGDERRWKMQKNIRVGLCGNTHRRVLEDAYASREVSYHFGRKLALFSDTRSELASVVLNVL